MSPPKTASLRLTVSARCLRSMSPGIICGTAVASSYQQLLAPINSAMGQQCNSVLNNQLLFICSKMIGNAGSIRQTNGGSINRAKTKAFLCFIVIAVFVHAIN